MRALTIISAQAACTSRWHGVGHIEATSCFEWIWLDWATASRDPGRADNDVFPVEALEDIRAAVEFLRTRYGVRECTLAGLCSGAYHALRAAVAGMPVNRILMVNPANYFWKAGESLEDSEDADRGAVRARRGGADRRYFRFHRAAGPGARKEKPKSLRVHQREDRSRSWSSTPDFAVGFSDIQAEIARELIEAGIEVWISNHRWVEGILGYMRRLGALVGAAEKAEQYARALEGHLESIRGRRHRSCAGPRVYFEEWDEPRSPASAGCGADPHRRRRRCVSGGGAALSARIGSSPIRVRWCAGRRI